MMKENVILTLTKLCKNSEVKSYINNRIFRQSQ